ncbi:MAG TPA: hypothetical protein VN861_02920 [Candidatus Acidoferrales bacterium]|nr:hypothetical protein [Candidatus Acidoferrales bacterium]
MTLDIIAAIKPTTWLASIVAYVTATACLATAGVVVYLFTHSRVVEIVTIAVVCGVVQFSVLVAFAWRGSKPK